MMMMMMIDDTDDYQFGQKVWLNVTGKKKIGNYGVFC
jgi:hypothetical protein